MAKTIVSRQGTLQGRDWIKGLIQAVLAPLLAYVADLTSGGSLNFDWKQLVAIGISAAAVYLLRNLGEQNKVVHIVGSKEEAERVADATEHLTK